MSTRVDFYLLNQVDSRTIVQYACRLLNKAYQAGLRVFVLTESSAQSQEIDKHLWASFDANFIPHAMAGKAEATDPLTKICIGHSMSEMPATDSASGFDMLVNMQTGNSLQGTELSRVAELVSADEGHINAARMRYRAWRDSGAELSKHDIQLS